MNHKLPFGASVNPVSETNEYEGESHGNYGRTYKNRADSRGPTVAHLLACHDRQSADQRYGTRNGPTVQEVIDALESDEHVRVVVFERVSLRSLLPTQLSCEGEGEVRQR